MFNVYQLGNGTVICATSGGCGGAGLLAMETTGVLAKYRVDPDERDASLAFPSVGASPSFASRVSMHSPRNNTMPSKVSTALRPDGQKGLGAPSPDGMIFVPVSGGCGVGHWESCVRGVSLGEGYTPIPFV